MVTVLGIGNTHVEGEQALVASTEGGNEKDDSGRRLMKRIRVDYGVGDPTELAPSRWGIHASVKVFDRLENAMAVYGGSGGRGRRGNAARPEVKHCRRRVDGTGPCSKDDLP